jgi:Tol biopolymer transport system component
MDADGRNPVKLTDGLEDGYPTISPDGKWVIYSSLSGAKPSLLKVSIDGGNAVSFSNEPGVGPTISPDGKHVAYLYPESPDPFAPPNRIAIAKFDDGTVEKTFSIQSNGTVPALVHWSADGKSILHSLNANNVSNIWQQSVEGGTPKQITNFKDNLITGYAWSNDGKELVCTRGILLRDAVLVTDTK